MRRFARAFALACVIAVAFARCGGTSSTSTPATPTPTVTGVTVTGPSPSAKPGDTAQFTATAALSNGTTQTASTQATWQSSNTTVATVSSSGLVTAMAAGEADIRATYQSVTGSMHLTVSGPAPPGGPLPGLECGVERWSVKTLSDADASRVSLAQVQQTTIKALNDHPTHCSGLPSARTFAEEFEVYEVIARITYVRLEDDRDYHIALADPGDSSYTIVTEVADIACQGAASSPHRDALETARHAFVSLLGGRSPSSLVGTTVRVRGVGFFDFNHGQNGRARNCMELHPIVSIDRMP